jgi:hypothetical protein
MIVLTINSIVQVGVLQSQKKLNYVAFSVTDALIMVNWIVRTSQLIKPETQYILYQQQQKSNY